MSNKTEEQEIAMKKALNLIKCKCGYYNKKKYINIYGTCRMCGRVLDLKAKFYFAKNRKG